MLRVVYYLSTSSNSPKQTQPTKHSSHPTTFLFSRGQFSKHAIQSFRGYTSPKIFISITCNSVSSLQLDVQTLASYILHFIPRSAQSTRKTFVRVIFVGYGKIGKNRKTPKTEQDNRRPLYHQQAKADLNIQSNGMRENNEEEGNTE